MPCSPSWRRSPGLWGRTACEHRSKKCTARLMVKPPPASSGSSIQSQPAARVALRRPGDEAKRHVLKRRDAVLAREEFCEIAVAKNQRKHRGEHADAFALFGDRANITLSETARLFRAQTGCARQSGIPPPRACRRGGRVRRRNPASIFGRAPESPFRPRNRTVWSGPAPLSGSDR